MSQDIEQPPVVLPDVVETDRLRLVLFTPEDAAGMLAGRRRVSWHPDYPREDDRDAASMVKEGAADASWGPRHVVRRGDGTTVGSIGFYGGPVDGEVEVGYGLVPDARGHGAVSEALVALLAEADRTGVRVRARVRPENTPSLRVLARCGFTQLRGTTEDGELRWCARCPPHDEPARSIASPMSQLDEPGAMAGPAWSPPTSTAPWCTPTGRSRRARATRSWPPRPRASRWSS